MTLQLTAFVVAVLLGSSWGVRVVGRLAYRVGLVAVSNERSSHAGLMPVGGGIAIVVVTIAAWTLLESVMHVKTGPHAAVYILGAAFVAAISLIDDVRHIPVGIRLAVHLGVALFFARRYAAWSTVIVPVLGSVHLGIMGTPLTVLWIVGLINAYNFMDGLDGLLAGQAAAAGLGWCAIGLLAGNTGLAMLGLLLGAGSLGFLRHNWHPARIFMGDTGSTFLGYSYAVLPIIAARQNPRLALVGVLLVWPAVFDAAFTVSRRLRRRESIFSGHQTFLFHRLAATGWRHDGIAALYIVLVLGGATLAYAWALIGRSAHVAVGLGICLGCAGLWWLVFNEEDAQVRGRPTIGQRMESARRFVLGPGHRSRGRRDSSEVVCAGDEIRSAIARSRDLCLRARYRDALVELRWAVREAEQGNISPEHGLAIAMVAYVNGLMGATHDGLRWIEAALRQGEDFPPDVRAGLEVARASLLWRAGAHREVLAAAEHAITLLSGGSGGGIPAIRIPALTWRGAALLALDRPRDAVTALEMARREAAIAGDYLNVSRAANTLATHYEKTGNPAQSGRLLEEALDAAEHLGDPTRLAFMLYRTGRRLHLAGNMSQAREILQRAFDIDRAAGRSWVTPHLLAGLASLSADEGRWREALPMARQCRSIAESTGEAQLQCESGLIIAQGELEARHPKVAETSLARVRQLTGLGSADMARLAALEVEVSLALQGRDIAATATPGAPVPVSVSVWP